MLGFGAVGAPTVGCFALHGGLGVFCIVKQAAHDNRLIGGQAQREEQRLRQLQRALFRTCGE